MFRWLFNPCAHVFSDSFESILMLGGEKTWHICQKCLKIETAINGRPIDTGDVKYSPSIYVRMEDRSIPFTLKAIEKMNKVTRF